MVKKVIGVVECLGICAIVLLFCANPQNPYVPGNAGVSLYFKDSKGVQSAGPSVTDTVGNNVRVGVCPNLYTYIDSVSVSILDFKNGGDSVIIIKNFSSDLDTEWFSFTFTKIKKFNVLVKAFQGGNFRSKSGEITIYGKTVSATIQPATESVVVDSVAAFMITSNADTPATYQWYHDTAALAGQTGISFVKNNVTLSDSGKYKCLVIDKWGDTGVTATPAVLTVRANPQIIDTIKPAIKLLDPAKDSISINANSYTVKVVSKDASGVASVVCTFGTTNITATKSADTVWSATVSGLVSGALNKITIVATDASANANKDTLIFYIKYDPTMTDLTSPVFFQKSGPLNNAVVTAPNIVLVDSIVDPSGVDTVSWTLNGASGGALKPDTANYYTVNVQLTTYHTNKIIIFASDKSTNHNWSADTILLDYNVPPLANDQTLSTKKDTPLAVTLTANAVDGDPLSNWIIVTQPQNGALSGTAPVLTYTATTGFTGLDNLTFTVSDGINTSLPAKIKINISDVLVAPTISNQLVDTVVNQGTKVAFSVVINSGANPTPAFAWKKQGQTSVICTTQTFTISQTKYSDEGKYHCVVSNSQGTDSTTWVTLTVRDLTKPVIFLKGANPQNIILGSPYIELGDSAYDDRDGIITSIVVRDTTKVNTALAGTYKVTYSVKDSAGNLADTATRTVVIGGVAPMITNISGNQKVCVGVQATFSVTASGAPAPRYQWMKGTAAAPGTSTNSTYQITPSSLADAGSFYCIVANGISPDAQTQNMTLTVDSPPVISMPNHDTTITRLVGDSLKMTIVASGSDTLHYQWYKGSSPLGTEASLTIKAITFDDSGSYTCSVTNTCKTTNSKVFTLTVNSTPSITMQPLSQILNLAKSTTFIVVATGKPAPTYAWQKNGAAISGATSASYTIPSPGISDSGKYTVTVTNSAGSLTSDTARFYAVVKSVAAGDNHSLFLKTDGTVFACGLGNSGQLGDSTGANRNIPKQIMTGVQNISAGGAQSLFLKTDGTLYGCGYNGDGELGDGTLTDRLFPVQIMTGVQTMSTGESHTLILRTNGTLFACGSNYYGQLGDGTRTNRLSPVQVKTGVKGIAAGGYHSLILMADGTLLSCGSNNLGQLGDSTTKNDSIPVKIMTGIQDIAAGNSHSLILETGGSLFACGNNQFGQLGDGTTNNQNSPMPITTAVQNIDAGGYHSLVLKTDGTLLACGSNNYGQLGDGTTNNQLTPVQVKTAVQSAAAGENHSLILMKDGTLFVCGYNSNGQLGNGSTSNQYIPVKIAF
jgi:alpha-tubulin suppressor-like RCC1 family protein